jgi:catechol 2,3-dioxygenase-like lactoylglutathione lyase family enzyme
MTSPTQPSVECEKMHITLPVSDLAATIEFYVTKLGFGRGFCGESLRFLPGSRWGKWRFF